MEKDTKTEEASASLEREDLNNASARSFPELSSSTSLGLVMDTSMTQSLPQQGPTHVGGRRRPHLRRQSASSLPPPPDNTDSPSSSQMSASWRSRRRQKLVLASSMASDEDLNASTTTAVNVLISPMGSNEQDANSSGNNLGVEVNLCHNTDDSALETDGSTDNGVDDDDDDQDTLPLEAQLLQNLSNDTPFETVRSNDSFSTTENVAEVVAAAAAAAAAAVRAAEIRDNTDVAPISLNILGYSVGDEVEDGDTLGDDEGDGVSDERKADTGVNEDAQIASLNQLDEPNGTAHDDGEAMILSPPRFSEQRRGEGDAVVQEFIDHRQQHDQQDVNDGDDTLSELNSRGPRELDKTRAEVMQLVGRLLDGDTTNYRTSGAAKEHDDAGSDVPPLREVAVLPMKPAAINENRTSQKEEQPSTASEPMPMGGEVIKENTHAVVRESEVPDPSPLGSVGVESASENQNTVSTNAIQSALALPTLGGQSPRSPHNATTPKLPSDTTNRTTPTKEEVNRTPLSGTAKKTITLPSKLEVDTSTNSATDTDIAITTHPELDLTPSSSKNAMSGESFSPSDAEESLDYDTAYAKIAGRLLVASSAGVAAAAEAAAATVASFGVTEATTSQKEEAAESSAVRPQGGTAHAGVTPTPSSTSSSRQHVLNAIDGFNTSPARPAEPNSSVQYARQRRTESLGLLRHNDEQTQTPARGTNGGDAGAGPLFTPFSPVSSLGVRSWETPRHASFGDDQGYLDESYSTDQSEDPDGEESDDDSPWNKGAMRNISPPPRHSRLRGRDFSVAGSSLANDGGSVNGTKVNMKFSLSSLLDDDLDLDSMPCVDDDSRRRRSSSRADRARRRGSGTEEQRGPPYVEEINFRFDDDNMKRWLEQQKLSESMDKFTSSHGVGESLTSMKKGTGEKERPATDPLSDGKKHKMQHQQHRRRRREATMSFEIEPSRTMIVHELRRGNWTWALEWSPDGTRLAVATADHHLAIVDTASSPVWKIVHDHRISSDLPSKRLGSRNAGDGVGAGTQAIRSIAWGNEFIAVGGTGDAVSIIVPQRDYRVVHVIRGTGFVGSLHWRPNASMLAIGSREDQCILVDIQRQMESPADDLSYSIGVGADDTSSVASFSSYLTSTVSSTVGRRGLRRTPPVNLISEVVATMERKDWVNAVSFSPGGSALAVGDRSGRLSVFTVSVESSPPPLKTIGEETSGGENSETPERVAKPTISTSKELKFKDAVLDVAWTPDGKYLCSGGEDFAVTVFDSSTWSIIRRMKRPRWVQYVSPSSGAGHLAVGGSQGDVTLLSSSDEFNPTAYLGYGGMFPLTAKWHPRDHFLAVAGQDPNVHILETTSLRMSPGMHLRSTSGVLNVDFSPDGKILAAGNEEGIIAFFDVTSPDGDFVLLYETLLGDDTFGARTIRWSPDGQYVVVGGGRRVFIFNSDNPPPKILYHDISRQQQLRYSQRKQKNRLRSATGLSLRTMMRSFRGVQHVAIHPAGTRVAIGGTRTMLLEAGDDENKEDGESFRSIRGIMDEVIYASSWSPDGSLYAMVGRDRNLTICDSMSYRILFTIRCDGIGLALTWGPSVRAGLQYLAFGGEDRSVTILEVRTHEATWETVISVPRPGNVTDLAWSHGGLLAVAVADGSVTVIDLAYLQNGRAVNEMDYNWQRQGVTSFLLLRRPQNTLASPPLPPIASSPSPAFQSRDEQGPISASSSFLGRRRTGASSVGPSSADSQQQEAEREDRGSAIITSVRWMPFTSKLAIGSDDGVVEIIDLTERCRMPEFCGGEE